MGGNVTRAPRSRAMPVVDPAIETVRSRRSGRMLDVQRLIGRFRYDHVIPLRAMLKRAALAGRPRLACATCGVTVFLASSPIKRLYFRHRHEDGSCPAVTRTGLTEAEIRAMQYRGAQESDAHRRSKALLMRSLAADPRFHDLAEERTWRASEGLSGLRRPDVSARINGLRVAFEVQLSSTFLDVVVGRQEFYRVEKAALIWVLPAFLPSYRRMTHDDILFGNNSNLLIVDEGSAKASEEHGRLMLRCWYREPRLEGETIVDDWVERLVSWNDLAIDLDRQTAVAFDFAGAEAALATQLRAAREAAAAAAEAERIARIAAAQARIEAEHAEIAEALRRDLIDLIDVWDSRPVPIDLQSQWRDLNYRLNAYRVGLEGDWPCFTVPLRMMRLIESARTGKPVGFKYRQLIEIGHHLLHQHPGLLLGFGYLLRAYGTKAVFDAQDVTGRWKDKRRDFRPRLKSDPLFRLPDDEERLFAFLSEGRSQPRTSSCFRENTARAPDCRSLTAFDAATNAPK